MRKLWYFISIVVGLTSCYYPDIQRDQVVVLGHGGSGFVTLNNHLPPNSEASIRRAIEIQGADGIEVDVQLTSDNQIVLYHDDLLESSTNESGYISNRSLKELGGIRYSGKGTAHSGKHTIWSLAELVEYLNGFDAAYWISLNIQPQEEIEDQDYDTILVESLIQEISKYKHPERVFIESPELDHLEIGVNHSVPNLKWMWVIDINESNITELRDIGAHGFVTHFLDEDEASVELARSNDLDVVFYGLKIRQDFPRALDLQPDVVQTDNVPMTLSYLDQ